MKSETVCLNRLWQFEENWNSKGYRLIAGVDEAGRGPLAGPVVAAAVILPRDYELPYLNDSKKLTERRRENLYAMIREQAIAVCHEVIGEEVIDDINIYSATVRGMYAAIGGLAVLPDAVLVDAVSLPRLVMPHQAIVHGDALSASIAAASIIAKVERDRLMLEYDAVYPLYGFAKHKGYGTKKHFEALREFGHCPIHRRSFEPIKSMIYKR